MLKLVLDEGVVERRAYSDVKPKSKKVRPAVIEYKEEIALFIGIILLLSLLFFLFVVYKDTNLPCLCK